ncbi:MAG: phytoene desaturase [Ignavibacteriales bacterium]|nr:MAG: phytoene desaturase [Ignavibacteriales bacterium]
MTSGVRTAIIGSGLGGLSAAIRIASAGFPVDVYEQNSTAGGKAGVVSGNGFTFDSGPSLFTMNHVIDELFASIGLKSKDFIRLHHMKIICRYFYPDNTILDAFSDRQKFSDEILKKTLDKPSTLERYFDYCEKIYSLTGELFLSRDIHSPGTFISRNAFKALLNLKSIDLFRTMHTTNSSFFRDPKVVQLFDRYATYNGSNPYEAPATLNIIPHVEFNLGSYVIKEGIRKLPSTLKSIAEKKGAKFFFNSPVEKILLHEKNVLGLRVDGIEIPYDRVISNVDVNTTYKNLLGNGTINPSQKKTEPSLSGIVFYWGIEGLNPELEIHNILFSTNYEKEFDDIFNKRQIPEEPTVYIYISSKYNVDDAPPGCENWFVMINAPFNSGQDWEKETTHAREIILRIIKKRTGLDIRSRILFEHVLTPAEIEKGTGSDKGSIYGISSNNRNAAFLRHPNKSKKINGLFFCGGSVHPGGGIPLVILSGKLASDKVIRELKHSSNHD